MRDGNVIHVHVGQTGMNDEKAKIEGKQTGTVCKEGMQVEQRQGNLIRMRKRREKWKMML